MTIQSVCLAAPFVKGRLKIDLALQWVEQYPISKGDRGSSVWPKVSSKDRQFCGKKLTQTHKNNNKNKAIL